MKKVLVTLILVLAAAALIVLLNKNSVATYSVGSLHLPKIFESKEARLLFVGDMNFDRYIRQVGEKNGEDYIFSCQDQTGESLSQFLKQFDLVIGNLEGPITDNPSRSLGSEVGSDENFVFTFPPSTAKLLSKNNIGLVNLGNNHTLNFSRDGLLQTKKYLDEAGVKYFGLHAQAGDPDAAESQKVARMEIAGVPLSFVNWSDWNSDNTDITAAQIKKEAEAGRRVIVYAHWGDEYVPPPERVRRLARSFVDAGASLIIGSHPHIIQETEKLTPPSDFAKAPTDKQPSPNGREIPVYYSLGNFIFDQYWNKEVSTGLAVELIIKDGTFETVEHEVVMQRDGRTCVK